MGERLCLVHGLLPFPVGQWPRPNNAAPSLPPHYRAFDATTGGSAPAPRFGTLALAVGAACGLSLHVLRRDEAQVLTFHTKAWSSLAPPTCRMPLRYPSASRATGLERRDCRYAHPFAAREKIPLGADPAPTVTLELTSCTSCMRPPTPLTHSASRPRQHSRFVQRLHRSQFDGVVH